MLPEPRLRIVVLDLRRKEAFSIKDMEIARGDVIKLETSQFDRNEYRIYLFLETGYQVSLIFDTKFLVEFFEMLKKEIAKITVEKIGEKDER